MILELPIFFSTEETASLTALGIETDDPGRFIDNVTFLHIDVFEPYVEDGESFTCIISSGREFICPWPYQKVKNEIQRAASQH